MKTCKQCSKKFEPVRPLQRVCSPQCAYKLQVAISEKVKQTSDALMQKTKEENNRGKLTKNLQVKINTLIRYIDKYTPCISSGRIWKETDQAGHYFSTGAFPALRFNLFNIYSQSVSDNMYKSGEQAKMRDNIECIYGNDTMGYLSDLRVMYPELKLTQEEVKQAIKNTNECIKMVKAVWNGLPPHQLPVSERIRLRKECNELIGIYK